MKPRCILFAGPAGCSKTPVAYFLSWNLGLPVFNNDTIRTEVAEDKGEYIIQDPEYLKRRDDRLAELFKSRRSFILDASIDRTWERVKEAIDSNGYEYFLISYNISREFLANLYKAKNQKPLPEIVDRWLAEHAEFLQAFPGEISLTITDGNFKDRLDLSLEKVRAFLDI